MQLGTADVLVRAKTSAYQKKIDTAEKRIKTFGKTAVSSIGSVTTSFTTLAGVAGVGALTAAMVSTGAKFESEMATVQGVMRATTDEYGRLKAAALEMGEKTEWSASQSAEALRYMGMAGWSAEQSIGALPGVLNLATAANMDLGQAADIVTDSLTAMGLGIQDLSRFNDILTGTTTRSNTNIQMMGESLKYSAPIAKQYGVNVESLAAMIGTLANAGIKASDSGTDLRQAMVRNAKAAKELGTAENDLIGTLRAARAAGWGVNDVTEKYGLIASKSVLVLMDQIDAYDDLYESLQDVRGETTKLAEIKLDTLTGDFKILGSTIESVFLSTSDNINRDLRGAIQDLTKTIRENRDAIIDLFSGIVIAGTKALDVISKISRSISLLGVTAASSDKSLWDWLTLDDDGAKRWLQEIEDGTAFLKDQLHDVREEIEDFQSKINEADGTDQFIWSDEQVAGFQAKVDQLKVQEKRILESIQNIQDASNKIVSPTPGANHRNSYYSKIFGDGPSGNAFGGSGVPAGGGNNTSLSETNSMVDASLAGRFNDVDQSFERYVDLFRDGAQVTLDMRTKSERLADETARLNELFSIGAITSETHGRALAAAREEFSETADTIEEKGDGLFDGLGDATAGWATSYFSTLNDMVWGADASFDEILTSYGKMLTQMMLQQASSGLFNSAGGFLGSLVSGASGIFSGGGGDYTTITSSAAGGYAMAGGGVINEHVVGVGMSSGQSYEFGERGIQEIIAPTSDFKGVGAGGASINVVNNISVESSDDSDSDQALAKSIAAQIDVAVRRIIADEKRHGGILA